MAEKILIMGESGTGKSASIRNCDPNTTAIVNPVYKPLPFRSSKHFNTLNGVTDADEICNFMRNAVNKGAKMIIVDDFQYILAVPYMNRIKETGWDKYNDFGANYFSIIDICKELPEDVCVYYLTHCETLENGLTTVKLIGKMLREKITVEGLFTIVLKTGVSEGKYYFFTQNSGKDTVKSPMGMFDAFSVENDLKYIDDKIRNYYEFDDAKSDAEIKSLDETKAGEVEKPAGRRGRDRHTDTTTESKGRFAKAEEEKDKAREEYMMKGFKKIDEDPREEIPFEEATEMIEESLKEAQTAAPVEQELPFAPETPAEQAPAEAFESPKRRTRKARE